MLKITIQDSKVQHNFVGHKIYNHFIVIPVFFLPSPVEILRDTSTAFNTMRDSVVPIFPNKFTVALKIKLGSENKWFLTLFFRIDLELQSKQSTE